MDDRLAGTLACKSREGREVFAFCDISKSSFSPRQHNESPNTSTRSAAHHPPVLDGVAQSSPPAICAAPFTADKRATTGTVGTGTAASCTEKRSPMWSRKGRHPVQSRQRNRGDDRAQLLEITLRTDVSTTIDGGNKITIDGRGLTRSVRYQSSPNFQAHHHAGHDREHHPSERSCPRRQCIMLVGDLIWKAAAAPFTCATESSMCGCRFQK